jgi:hypothetical protein
VTPLVIVRLSVAVSVSPPPLPVMVTVDVPTAAAPLAVRVSVDVPAPPAILAGLNAAVTPDGKPLAVSATVLLNPPETALVTVELPEFPSCTLNEDGLADKEKLGVPPLTVRLTAVEFLMAPPVPRIPIR